MEGWFASGWTIISAHEPLVGAVIVLLGLWAVCRRLDLIAAELSIIARILTSTELGQERIEKRLSEQSSRAKLG